MDSANTEYTLDHILRAYLHLTVAPARALAGGKDAEEGQGRDTAEVARLGQRERSGRRGYRREPGPRGDLYFVCFYPWLCLSNI